MRDVLDDLHAGRLGEDHVAQVWVDEPAGPPAGWVYFSSDSKADRVWELWWIGVSPARHGQGIGDELLRFVESHVRAVGGRLLLIETSSLPELERTRQFYAKRGYAACGLVPDFYADGDGKVIFAKRITAWPRRTGLGFRAKAAKTTQSRRLRTSELHPSFLLFE